MANALFTGSGVALITPFKDGEVDYEALGRLIDRQIACSTDALIVCGTTGEPATMTDDEKASVLSFAIERAAGRLPVIAGTGCNDTRRSVAQSKSAVSLGADGLLMVTPYYNKTTQAGLVAHFTAVADEVNVPIILYNVPSRTGLNLLPETAARLAEHPNIRGVKEASGNIEQITELMRLAGDKLALYSGNDDHVVPLMALGARGVISVLANVMPRETHDMVASYIAGDALKARKIQFAVNPLVKLLFCEVNPIPVKAACELMGLCEDEVRLPLVPVSEANRARLRAALAEYHLA